MQQGEAIETAWRLCDYILREKRFALLQMAPQKGVELHAGTHSTVRHIWMKSGVCLVNAKWFVWNVFDLF